MKLPPVKDLNPQQRLLGVLAICALAILLANGILLRPLSKKILNLETQKTQLENTISENVSKSQIIKSVVQESVDNPLSSRSESYAQQEGALDKSLKAFYEELVTPQEMTDVLRKMIKDNKKLHIVSLEGLPLIDVMAESKIPEELLQSENAPHLYKRGVSLNLKGEYFEIMNYLKDIEDLPKRLIWGEFSYTVTEYPQAEVKLTVYTLTTSKEWVGG